VAIIRHVGASRGYDQNDKRQHFTGCVTVMGFQPASITKTGEASLRAPAAICPALYNATGRAAPRTAATTRPAQYCVAGEAGLRAAANIPVQYNATGEAGLCAVADMGPVPYQTAEKDRLYAYAGIRGQSVLSAFLDGSKAGIRRPSLLTGDWEDPQDSIDAWNLPDQETTL
jgi:hypothetical protein